MAKTFSVKKAELTIMQLEQIQSHLFQARRLGMEVKAGDEWEIREDDTHVHGTRHQNGGINMDEFLTEIGIISAQVVWVM